MTKPVAEHLRNARWFMKTITGVVVVAFANLTLQPLAIAASLPAAPKQTERAETNDEKLEHTLHRIEDRLERLDGKLQKREAADTDKAELRALRQSLETLDTTALQDFAAIAQHIADKKLPSAIRQRHEDAVKQYLAEMTALKANLDAVDTARDETERGVKLKKAKTELAEKRKKHRREPLQPNKLPERVLKPNKNNKPKNSRQEYSAAGLLGNPAVQLAAHGNFVVSGLPGASDPAYLGATPEVVLSDAIRALADELEHDPVKIFNWVYANTEWIPTWGAIQNSDAALATRKGNAFDLASLLVALLRASGIPARYVHGTIDVPTTKFMNWAGGFTHSDGAWELASASGLPIVGMTSGGEVKAFRIEHVWVEAALDFRPSRGAVNRSADTWVALDPSFKQYVQEQAYDVYRMLNFNGGQFMANYFADTADKTPYQYYSGLVMAALDTQIPDWTLKGLYGHERVSPIKETIGGNLRLFAASLPYKMVVKGYTAAQIPESLRHRVDIGLANDPRYGVDASYSISLPELGKDRLTLSYIPESAADDAVVNDYGSLFSAPAYLVRVKPVLRRNGVTVAVGNGTTLGEKQHVVLNLMAPTVSAIEIDKKVTAGSYNAIVVQGQKSAISQPSLSMQQLMANAERNEQGLANMDDLLGQLLHNIGIGWFFHWVYERDFYATTTQVAYTTLPSQAFVTADVTTHYFFGLPRSVSIGIFNIDAHRDTLAMGAINGEGQRKKDFMILGGMTGSSWEHLIYEGFLNVPAGSAVKLLKLATAQGIPVYRINRGNSAQILPLLSIPGEDLLDITNAINAGMEVTVSRTDVRLDDNYSGVGYIVLDPETGAGPYYLSGGLAGGVAFSVEEWKQQVYNKPRVTALARNLVVGWAKVLIGTPYGFGCKDPFFTPPNNYCLDRYGPDDVLRIDCSGLVAFAYDMIGFPFFNGKNAVQQHGTIESLPGSFPPENEARAGDIIFWQNTYKPGISHVGLFLEPGLWIAAQSKEVGIYRNTPYWAQRFLDIGSVLGN